MALELERTFWEKATILHTEYHRPAEKPTPERFSRHYADTAALARHPAVMKAIDKHDLRDRVVTWKGQFFGSSWANYDLAKPGSFRLVPPAERQPPLRRDYQAMRDMYLSEPTPFDDVLATLAELENRINHAGANSRCLSPSFGLGANWEQGWQCGSSANTMWRQRESGVITFYFSICNEKQRGSNTSHTI